MTKRVKKGGRDFKPGETGNPHGRPPLSAADRALKKMTREVFSELQQLFMTSTRDEIMDYMNGPSVSYESELFIRHMLALGENPNWSDYSKYLDRRIGKVKDEVEINLVKPTVIRRHTGEEVVLGVKEEEQEE